MHFVNSRFASERLDQKPLLPLPSKCKWQSLSYWIVPFLDNTSEKVYFKIMLKR